MEPSSPGFTVDVRRLRVLRELADRGTVVATAAALHLTPSAVSQQIAVLAREAGVPLLARAGRGVVLTDAARILLAHADAIHAQLERARHDLLAHADGGVGRLGVGAFATAISGLLCPVLADWRRERPGVDVRVHEVEGEDALTALHHGEVDAAVVMEWRRAPARGDARYARRPLLRDPLDLLLPADHPLATAAADEPVALSDLAEEVWVTGLSGPCQDVVLDACTAAGFTPLTHHRSGDWTAVGALVAAGRGLALVPRLAVTAAPPGTALRRLAHPRPTRPVSLVTRAGSEGSPLLAALVQALVERARRVS
ncbi:LysR substrate-binding domain-containing protein [Quadrisphaera sp. DSM 44207]|uniref:LysR substrate-binding domain-containing protein n=1 Tax=Quadrisphaera sp. DSM 44207 TaxID=1881057 RepID=UPI00088ECB84|nr:LysR substrate-binding domain-containing protein [Quadrisphaera sp. DSM 44207]SDQ89426.1 DNA-binding transcriptional regulator, LysR family [Quadrisphaera sp. DSM 44207]